MAPLKQPNSLFDSSVKRVARIAERACIGITKRQGQYRRRKCRTAIHRLRDYILANIGHSFDDVCQQISRFPPSVGTPELKDPRVLVDFMLHENTQVVPKLWHMVHLSPPRCSRFWEEQFRTSVRCTPVIDISKLKCTDAMMKTICESGRQLQKIFFSSGSKDFSAKGLMSLTNCPDLTIIDDRFYFEKFSQDKIRILLNSFPKIISLNYLHMGALLSGGFSKSSLGLLSLDEKDAREEHIKAIARICPNLKRLVLGRDEECFGDYPLQTLAETDLNVVELQLIDFPFDDILPMLRVKGACLTTLKIVHVSSLVAAAEIVLIGQTCPLLKELWFAILESGDEGYEEKVTVTKREEREMFRHLQVLQMEGVILFDSGIVQRCLQNAKHVRDITLRISGEHTAMLPDPLAAFLAKNELKQLTQLFIAGQKLKMFSVSVVETFFTKLVSLKVLHVEALMSAEVVDYFRHMDAMIRERNMDLILYWENRFDGEMGQVRVAYDGDEEDESYDEERDEEKVESDAEENEENN